MAAITTIQVRRGTAAQWTAANPILAAGEFGWESDTAEFKVGDGVTAWATRPYWISDVAAHSHPASQISDATSFGRTLIQVADAAAARAAIGAGTSNLVIGVGASNAMAGNKTFSFSEITGIIGTAQLPPLAVNNVYPVANQAAMLALTAERGDMAIRTDIGETYVLSTDSPATLGDWLMITSPGNVTSVAGRQGAIVLVKADVGLSNVDNTSDANKPISTATATALAGKEAAFAAGTTAQYRRGDKSWQTLDKAAVGLTNVDNTADASKPVSAAQQTALNAKENTIAAGTAAQYYRGDKTWATNDKASVGLGSVDNTSDAAKPVSTAQQTALNLKANLASPAFTGTPTGITKAHVGLGSVDNTADTAKPVSTAQQTALNLKANTTHTHVAADIISVDGGTP
jgi:hypothetical protein